MFLYNFLEIITAMQKSWLSKEKPTYKLFAKAMTFFMIIMKLP